MVGLPGFGEIGVFWEIGVRSAGTALQGTGVHGPATLVLGFGRYRSTLGHDVHGPLPLLQWAEMSHGNPCDFCSAQPQTAFILDQTWHDEPQLRHIHLPRSASINPLAVPTSTSTASTSQTPPTSPSHSTARPRRPTTMTVSTSSCSAPFFAAHNLAPNVNHTVGWVVHQTKTNGSSALFDYAVFTADLSASSSSFPFPTSNPDLNSTPYVPCPPTLIQKSTLTTPPRSTPKKKSPSGDVSAGAVIAALAGLGIIATIVFFLLRRQRHALAPAHIEPLVVANINTNTNTNNHGAALDRGHVSYAS
ncbi:hypothetical protein C8J57DRAFT_1505241 [Mycena rebaudengoi]|nr:hypothetical protein C8J57DRAFT_1505241 [Mycena rebaudengoi]